MSVHSILEIAVSLAFLYFFLSLTVMWINEGIARIWNIRANRLFRAIGNIILDLPEYIQDPDRYCREHNGYRPFVEIFYDHPIIKSLGAERRDPATGCTVLCRRPSYIPASLFSRVTLNILLGEGDSGDYAGKRDRALLKRIEGVPYPKAKQMLLTFWESGAKDLAHLQKEVEAWFDSIMDRLSGWYKRRAQLFSLVLGLSVAVAFNIDTLNIAGALFQMPAERARIVKAVENKMRAYSAEALTETEAGSISREFYEEIRSFEIPGGWKEHGPSTSRMAERAKSEGGNVAFAVFRGWLAVVTGWILTGLAVSLGAPFWFDLINKFINIRSSGLLSAAKGRPAG